MPEQFIEKVTGFLLRPVETFQQSRADTLESAFIYYLPLLVLYVILSTLMASLGFDTLLSPETKAMPGFTPLVPAIAMFLVGILCPFIAGAFLQIGVAAAGGTKGYVPTVRAYMYACTPGYLLGWIPIIGIIAMLWNIVLEVIGIRELQEISTGKAILAIVIGLVVIVVIIIILAAVIAAFVFGMAGAVKSG
jgi:hypothetical protein